MLNFSWRIRAADIFEKVSFISVDSTEITTEV